MGVKVRDDPPGSGVWFIFVNHKGKRCAKKVGSDKRVANQIARKSSANWRPANSGS